MPVPFSGSARRCATTGTRTPYSGVIDLGAEQRLVALVVGMRDDRDARGEQLGPRRVDHRRRPSRRPCGTAARGTRPASRGLRARPARPRCGSRRPTASAPRRGTPRRARGCAGTRAGSCARAACRSSCTSASSRPTGRAGATAPRTPSRPRRRAASHSSRKFGREIGIASLPGFSGGANVGVVRQVRIAAHAEVVLHPALGRQPVVVPAHRVEDLAAAHALEAGDRVGLHVAERRAHVQRAADRGRRRVDREDLGPGRGCGRTGTSRRPPTPPTSALRARRATASRGSGAWPAIVGAAVPGAPTDRPIRDCTVRRIAHTGLILNCILAHGRVPGAGNGCMRLRRSRPRARRVVASCSSRLVVLGDGWPRRDRRRAPRRTSVRRHASSLQQPIVGMARDADGPRLLARRVRRRHLRLRRRALLRLDRRPCASTSRSSAWPRRRSGHGYWLVASDGGIFTFGDARFHGSTGGIRLNKPIVGMAATPTGQRLLARRVRRRHLHLRRRPLLRLDRRHPPQPARSSAWPRTPTGHGYWLVASDGGIFTFGDARFYGSTGGRHARAARSSAWRRPRPATATGSSRADGGIFTFGDAHVLRLGGGHARGSAPRSASRRRRRTTATGSRRSGARSTPRRRAACASTRTSCRNGRRTRDRDRAGAAHQRRARGPRAARARRRPAAAVVAR